MPAEQEATADVAAPVTPAEPAPEEETQSIEDVQEGAAEVDGSGTVDVTDMPAPAADIPATMPPVVDSSAQPGGATDKPYQLLAMAREAFWMHNYAEAETHYRDLIALEPDNPDGYGELGNMYFTRGNWEQAANAYFNAGKRLIQTGRIEQAEVLVKVIRGLNGKQADELEAMLKAADDTDKSQ
jgi:tetratricopeptide (TPR) repeat protein